MKMKMTAKEAIMLIAEKYGKPSVQVIYGYDYKSIPTLAGSGIMPAEYFQIQKTYTGELCVEDQTACTGNGYGLGETDYPKKVIFSAEAVAMCKELKQALAPINEDGHLDFYINKSGVDKLSLFSIVVEQPIS